MIKRSLQYIIGYAISIVVAVFVIVFSINEGGFTFENDAAKLISDAAFINVIMFVGIWLLTIISQQGTFDIFAYSFKKLRASLFRKNEKYQDVPKTFYDYRVLKQEEEHQKVHYLGIIGATWAVIMLIALICYYN
jgi:hypothetical protein